MRVRILDGETFERIGTGWTDELSEKYGLDGDAADAIEDELCNNGRAWLTKTATGLPTVYLVPHR